MRKILKWLESFLGITHTTQGEAYDCGFNSFMVCISGTYSYRENPYLFGTQQYEDWKDGFYSAYQQWVHK